MAKPGPKKKSYLAAVREGDTAHRSPKKGAVVPAGHLVEPEWAEVFTDVTIGSAPRKPRGVADDSDEMAVYFDDVLRHQELKHLRDDNARARAIAQREWRRVVPVLIRSVGLADVDEAVVRDYCVCVARLDMCERGLSRVGLVIRGERGWMKNGLTTIAGQYRTQLKAYVGELGLSPSSRTGIDPAAGDDPSGDPDPFD